MMRCKLHAAGYTFPYLYDADQSVAQAYKAMCTPEFYIFDQRQELAYHGRFDESRPKNDKPVTGGSSMTCTRPAQWRSPELHTRPLGLQQPLPVTSMSIAITVNGE